MADKSKEGEHFVVSHSGKTGNAEHIRKENEVDGNEADKTKPQRAGMGRAISRHTAAGQPAEDFLSNCVQKRKGFPEE